MRGYGRYLRGIDANPELIALVEHMIERQEAASQSSGSALIEQADFRHQRTCGGGRLDSL